MTLVFFVVTVKKVRAINTGVTDMGHTWYISEGAYICTRSFHSTKQSSPRKTDATANDFPILNSAHVWQMWRNRIYSGTTTLAAESLKGVVHQRQKRMLMLIRTWQEELKMDPFALHSRGPEYMTGGR